jgi:hypothetical protein
MGKRAALLFLVSTALTAGQALGQTAAQPPLAVAPAGETILKTPDVELQFGPRFWYLVEANGLFNPPNPAFINTTQSITFPMAGATLSSRFSTLPDTTFILSALYGKTTFSVVSNCVGCKNGSPAVITDTNNVNRYDFELLAQTAVPDANWGWILGARLEHESVGMSEATTSFNPITFFPSTKTSGASNIGTVKAGIAGAIPMTTSGDLSFFGNIIGLAGVRSIPSRDDFLIGPDMSIGIQYVVSPASGIVASLRYRALIEYFPGGNAGVKYAVSQGPLIDLTFKF